MMNITRSCKRLLACCSVAALCVVALQQPAWARHPDLDLDALSDDQIDHLLDEEMDDASLTRCGLSDENAAVPVNTMYDIIMCALSDEGDVGDETDLDFDDLEDEMHEARTTVAAVVRKAMVEADRIARQDGAPGGSPSAIARVPDRAPGGGASAVAMTPDGTAGDAQVAAPMMLAVTNALIKPAKVALDVTKDYVRSAIHAATPPKR